MCDCKNAADGASLEERLDLYKACKRKLKHFEKARRGPGSADGECKSSSEHTRSDDITKDFRLFMGCPHRGKHFGPSRHSYVKRIREFERAGLRITRQTARWDKAKAREGRARRTRRYMDKNPDKRAVYQARYWEKKLRKQQQQQQEAESLPSRGPTGTSRWLPRESNNGTDHCIKKSY
eukprot:g59026.t1